MIITLSQRGGRLLLPPFIQLFILLTNLTRMVIWKWFICAINLQIWESTFFPPCIQLLIHFWRILRRWWFENDSFVRCGSLLLPPCIYLSYFFSNSPAYFDVLKERFLGLIFMIVKQPNKTSQNLRPKTKFRQKSAQVSCLLLLPPLMTFDHTVDLVGDFVC